MIRSSIFYFLLIYHSSDLVDGNDLIVNIKHGMNNTFILSYNLTTNYSYYLTFRLFEHEQIKWGLFSPKCQQNTFRILNRSNSSTTLVYLFIICFHFIRQLNDLDIQCRDIRLGKSDQLKSFLPSYKPLFVPMMYALSILMLLPVIIQHRRQKQAKILERRKQLRRLSITIVQENPDILSSLVQIGRINAKQIELVSIPSIKTILDEVNDNDNITYTIPKRLSFMDKSDEELAVTADDCIAHLLNSTPWNSHPTQQQSIERNAMHMVKKQYMPRTATFDDEENDHQPILKSTEHCRMNIFNANPAFLESDV